MTQENLHFKVLGIITFKESFNFGSRFSLQPVQPYGAKQLPLIEDSRLEDSKMLLKYL